MSFICVHCFFFVSYRTVWLREQKNCNKCENRENSFSPTHRHPTVITAAFQGAFYHHHHRSHRYGNGNEQFRRRPFAHRGVDRAISESDPNIRCPVRGFRSPMLPLCTAEAFVEALSSLVCWWSPCTLYSHIQTAHIYPQCI